MHQILLLSDDINEIRLQYDVCVRNGYNFYFFDKMESFYGFLIHENIDVAVINQHLVDDPVDIFNIFREKDVDASFVFIGDKDTDKVRKLLKIGYFDYIYYGYTSEEFESSIRDAIENKTAFEKIKFISSNLEKINKNLLEKTEELEADRIRMKNVINKFRLIESFIREINITNGANLILEKLCQFISKEFSNNKVIITKIEGMQETVVASSGIMFDSIKNLKWDLSDIKSAPWAESILKGKTKVEVENPLENFWYSASSISSICPEGFFKLPIYYGEEVYGTAIVSYYTDGRTFSEDSLFYLKQIVDHAAMEIYSKRLQEKLSNTIEQLKEYQQQLIEKEKLSTLAKVAVSVNHEINNPLCAISLNAELIKRRYKDDENLQKIVDSILKNVSLINKITNKFANLRKVTFKEYLPGIEMLDLGD
ncbi:MAG: hypothetical protein N3C60_09235 [Calditerrivibrio sp.]|nr:hypothetical protein [Calditerrivibrio sp.]